MTDNVAILDGYTNEVEAEFRGTTLYLLVQSNTDLDSSFKAWCTTEQEFIVIHGWMAEHICEV